MPRNVNKKIKEMQKSFFKKKREKRRGKVPLKRKPVKITKIIKRRSKRLTIVEAADKRLLIKLKYVKLTTGEIKEYILEPYEYKYKRITVGLRKLLYAYDIKAKHIKNFLVRNIKKVEILNKKYRKRWPIKI